MDLLIVEDDEDTASFIDYVLKDEGYGVRMASSLAQAKQHLKQGKPDLIILDRGLPDGDGIKFCEELRRNPEFVQVPVLFLSSAKTSSEVLDGYGAGGDDYMTKPFGFLELVARVQTLLRRPGEGAHA